MSNLLNQFSVYLFFDAYTLTDLKTHIMGCVRHVGTCQFSSFLLILFCLFIILYMFLH